MQVVNKVLSKMNKKTELANHKIDLNKVDEIKKIVNVSRQVAADAIAVAKELEKEFQIAKKRVETDFKIVSENRKKVFEQVKELVNLATDLGMPLPKQLVKLYDDISVIGRSMPTTNLNNVFPI